MTIPPVRNPFNQFSGAPDQPQGNPFDQFDAPGSTAPTAAPSANTDPGWLASFAQGAGQGITFGFGDELMAGLKTGAGLWGDYGKEVEGQRKAIADAQAAHPGWFLGGNIAGALPTVAIPGLGVARATTVAGKLGAGLVGGTLTGAINGAGTSNSTTPEEFLKGAAIGGGIGGAAGVAAVPIGAAVGAGISRVLGRGGAKPLPPAMRKVAEGMRRDAVTGAPLHPEAMIMDAGPNVRRQAAAIFAMPGPGQAIVGNALKQRAAGAGARVTTALDTAFGAAKNIPKTVKQLMADRSAAAQPLYNRAYAAQMPWKDAVDFQATPIGRIVTQTPAGQRAFKTAQRLAANEGYRFNLDNVDMRALDYIKQALDDQISKLQRLGAGKEARAVIGLRERLVNDADRISPDYAAARAAYAGPSQIMDAVEAGKSAFARGTSPDELAEELAALSSSERDGFVVGARSAISQMMGTARNDAAAVWRDLAERGWNKEKLAMLLGPQESQRLLGSLDMERTFQGTQRGVMENSETAARAAAMKDFGVPAGDAVGATAGYVNGGIMGLLRGMGLKMAAGGANAMRDKQLERLAEEAARVLTATGKNRLLLERSLQAHINRVNGTARALPKIEGAARNLIGATVNTQVIPRFSTSGRF